MKKYQYEYPGRQSPWRDPLDVQLERCCRAMRSWDGTIDLPSNPLFVIAKDRENLSLLSCHRDLSLAVCGRIMDNHLRVPMVRDAARFLSGVPMQAILGYVSSALPTEGTPAVLLRELTARFVEKGVSRCA